MAFNREKKKIYISAAERQANLEIIENDKKRFPPKNIKASITFKRDGSVQDVVETGRYLTEDEAKQHAERMLKLFNSDSSGWKI